MPGPSIWDVVVRCCWRPGLLVARARARALALALALAFALFGIAVAVGVVVGVVVADNVGDKVAVVVNDSVAVVVAVVFIAAVVALYWQNAVLAKCRQESKSKQGARAKHAVVCCDMLHARAICARYCVQELSLCGLRTRAICAWCCVQEPYVCGAACKGHLCVHVRVCARVVTACACAWSAAEAVPALERRQAAHCHAGVLIISKVVRRVQSSRPFCSTCLPRGCGGDCGVQPVRSLSRCWADLRECLCVEHASASQQDRQPREQACKRGFMLFFKLKPKTKTKTKSVGVVVEYKKEKFPVTSAPWHSTPRCRVRLARAWIATVQLGAAFVLHEHG